MNTVICKKCGYSFENKEEGNNFCPNCDKEMKFIKLEAFCGAKPNELHEIN